MKNKLGVGSKVSFWGKGRQITGVVTGFKTARRGLKIARRLGITPHAYTMAIVAPDEGGTVWTVLDSNLKVLGQAAKKTLVKKYAEVREVYHKIADSKATRNNSNYENLEKRGLVDYEKGLKDGDKIFVDFRDCSYPKEKMFAKFARPSWKVGYYAYEGSSKIRYTAPQFMHTAKELKK